MFKFFKCLTSVFLAFSLCLSAAFAANGDGTGDGSGGNKDVALTLLESSVVSGDVNIALDVTIQLDFNKNVCNVGIQPYNKNCFHLTDADGNVVPIYVIFPDDQLQQKYKRQVFIKPIENLAATTEYCLAIDRTLIAKNGTAIDNAYRITFSTGKHTASSGLMALDELGDNIMTYESALAETEDSIPIATEPPAPEPTREPLSASQLSKIILIAAIGIVILFSIVIIIRKKRKPNAPPPSDDDPEPLT